MFTGIIEELGTVKFLKQAGPVAKLGVAAAKIARESQLGQSVCVNGVCLTVVEIDQDVFSFEIMPQTARCTNLGSLRPADNVNLERALRAAGRIDGHFVNGHIDGPGIIGRRQTKGGDIVIVVQSSAQLLRHIVLKGCVALDGVSLTVSAVNEGSFSVNLIPYTLKNTTLGLKKEADTVNIECDILAKYIDKLLSEGKQQRSFPITPSFLQEHGFISP